MSAATPAPTKLVLVATLATTGVAVAVFVGGRSAPLSPGFAAPFLWLFSFLFLVRVAGQIVVASRAPRPGCRRWRNGTSRRTALLLPTQIVILAVMAWIDISFSLDRGAPVHPHRASARACSSFAYVYAAAMAVRYALRMLRRPEARWFGGTIPIVFHLVLASYLYVFGWFHARTDARRS